MLQFEVKRVTHVAQTESSLKRWGVFSAIPVWPMNLCILRLPRGYSREKPKLGSIARDIYLAIYIHREMCIKRRYRKLSYRDWPETNRGKRM